MKFTYEEANEELISHYTIEENQITIYFLNGSMNKMPYTKAKEETILNIMLDQAIQRNEYYQNNYERERNLIFPTGNVAILISLLITVLPTDKTGKITLTLATAISLLAGVMIHHLTKNKDEVLNELEKYAIYLEIRRQLLALPTQERIFQGVNPKNQHLDINTIDNYSLKDIKRIQKKISRINFIIGH